MLTRIRKKMAASNKRGFTLIELIITIIIIGILAATAGPIYLKVISNAHQQALITSVQGFDRVWRNTSTFDLAKSSTGDPRVSKDPNGQTLTNSGSYAINIALAELAAGAGKNIIACVNTSYPYIANTTACTASTTSVTPTGTLGNPDATAVGFIRSGYFVCITLATTANTPSVGQTTATPMATSSGSNYSC